MNIEPKPSVATSARTRRTALSVAIAVIATIPIATGSSGASDDPTAADTTESTVPTTGSPDDDGRLPRTQHRHQHRRGRSPHVHRSRRLGEQRLVRGQGELRPDLRRDPRPVSANIFSDPCQWVEVDPPLGPTVDDLAAAFADVPVLNATEPTDVTVDGFHGKQIEFTVPDYTEDECIDGRFALFQESRLRWAGSQLLGARPPRPPSTVDPRRRRHPPGDRRHVLPGHLPAGPRRPRHDPQLHPNRALFEAEQSGDDDPVETSTPPSSSAS